jgi:hypothetical protein
MNKHPVVLLTLFLGGLASAKDAPLPPVTLAVLPFQGSEEGLQDKAVTATELLGAGLATERGIWLVERAEIDQILGEHAMKLSGLTDPATAAQTGKLIGARVLVTGRLLPNGNNYILLAKVMSTESSRVFIEKVPATSLDAMEMPVAELSAKIGRLVAKEKATFVPPVESWDDRIANLRAALRGKSLPSIRLSINEQAVRQATIDPAVETEFGKIIMGLGGEIVDAKQSVKPAEIHFEGEAFSEIGARRGQLTAARSRVEVKVTRQSDGKVLAIDRESTVAVDISDAVAGKTALQHAALTLAERILPMTVAP